MMSRASVCAIRSRNSSVPSAPAMQQLMPKVIGGSATSEEHREFGRLWQERVRRILIDRRDDPALVVLR